MRGQYSPEDGDEDDGGGEDVEDDQLEGGVEGVGEAAGRDDAHLHLARQAHRGPDQSQLSIDII